MTRYHVNPKTGEMDYCFATISCRFGESAPHGNTPDQARKAYELYVATDDDPKTDLFGMNRKKNYEKHSANSLKEPETSQEMMDRIARGESVRAIKDSWGKRTGRFLSKSAPALAVATGLIATVAVGYTVADNIQPDVITSSSSTVQQVEVETYMVPVKVGKVTTMQPRTKTKATVKVDDTGSTKTLTYQGRKDVNEGDSITVYQRNGGDYLQNQPGQTKDIAGAAAGLTAGVLGGIGSYTGFITLAEAIRRRDKRNNLRSAARRDIARSV